MLLDADEAKVAARFVLPEPQSSLSPHGKPATPVDRPGQKLLLPASNGHDAGGGQSVSSTGRIEGRTDGNAMVAMIEEFGVSREHGIPIVAMAGARLILDTGSPVSFARTGRITLGGCQHQVPVDCWAGDPDDLGELLGQPVDGLLGCDLLAGRILDLDCPGGRAYVTSGDTNHGTPCWLANSIALPFGTTMGVPVAQLSVNGQHAAAAVDTSAAVCFAAASLVGDSAEIGRYRDFHPAIGRFEADLHLVSICGGGAGLVDVAAAAAPPALAQFLAEAGLEAILGGDLLMGSETLFDFRAQSGVVLLSSLERFSPVSPGNTDSRLSGIRATDTDLAS